MFQFVVPDIFYFICFYILFTWYAAAREKNSDKGNIKYTKVKAIFINHKLCLDKTIG